MSVVITRQIVDQFDAILKRGLCRGVGKRNGQMCIEAAICAALDLPHGDDPECVSRAVRSYKIELNDADWSNPQARANGLRDLGIAQIGSRGVVDDAEFTKRLAEKTIRKLIPALFRETLSQCPDCLRVADRCEQEGSQTAAQAARTAAQAAWAAQAARATQAAAWAAQAARTAQATQAAAWAAQAARTAQAAAWAAQAARTAQAAAWAAQATAQANKYLLLSADLALETLRELKSPGVEWLQRERRG